MRDGPVVQVHLLGSVRVATDDGAPTEVGPAKCRAVLAVLALSVGEAVPVARLIDLVWGEHAPRTAEKTLQGYVADLRKVLGSRSIPRIGAAYRLDLPAEAVDVHRFRRHLAEGDPGAALGEWAGAPLATLDAPGIAPVVDGLVEQWLGAVEADLERRVRTDPSAAVAALTRLTAEHPFREGLWALLMTALDACGRQADALAAYRRARGHLVEELGVEPGPRLREVERLVLGQEAAPHGDDGHAPGPLPGLAAPRRGNLPARPPRLYGRDGELGAVVAALESSSVVTLTGPGGVGKTALAQAAAHRRYSGTGQRVWLVGLAEITEPDAVPRAVAATLGVVEGPAHTLTDSVVAVLRSRPTLLVLDNCEHVIDGAALLARAVAEHAPDTRVLATSREGLRIPAETLLAVEPLNPAGSGARLFVERARAAAGEVEAHAPEVVEICRCLDGMPLAIELAAARTRSLTPAQLLDRLDERLRLLTSGHRAGAERHRTLRATIAWSYDLLSAEQRVVFQRLSVFTGLFDLAAAEAVTAWGELDAVDVDRLLGELVERSMVVAESGPSGRRFRLLETLRTFAAGLLGAEGEPEEAARRHTRWCRGEVDRIHALLTGLGEPEGVVRLAELWPELRAAVGRACAAGDAVLADALVRPVAQEVNLRRRAEIGDWAERILALLPADDEDGKGFWLLWAALRYAQVGDDQGYERTIARHGHREHPVVRFAHSYLYDDGEEGYTAALAAIAWLRERGEEHAASLVEVAGVASDLIMLGRLAEADTFAAALQERYRRRGSPTMLYFALGLRGVSAQFQGGTEQAAAFFTAAAGVEIPPGTYPAHRTAEARIAFDQGHRLRALRMLRDHVEGLVDADYGDVARMVAIEFVHMATVLGRLGEAARVLRYLDTTGTFGALVRTTQLAEEAALIAAAPEAAADEGPALDAHQVLAYMRDVLDDLCGRADEAPISWPR